MCTLLFVIAELGVDSRDHGEHQQEQGTEQRYENPMILEVQVVETRPGLVLPLPTVFGQQLGDIDAIPPQFPRRRIHSPGDTIY